MVKGEAEIRAEMSTLGRGSRKDPRDLRKHL